MQSCSYAWICFQTEPLEYGPEIDIDLYALNHGTLRSNVYKLVALPDGGAIIRAWISPGVSGIARVSPEGIVADDPIYNNSAPMTIGINYDEENGWAIPLRSNGEAPVVTLEEPHEIVTTHHIPNINYLMDCDVIPVSIM